MSSRSSLSVILSASDWRGDGLTNHVDVELKTKIEAYMTERRLKKLQPVEASVESTGGDAMQL